MDNENFQQTTLPLDLPQPLASETKLRLPITKRLPLHQKDSVEIEGIPRLILPTRWEHLQPKIENSNVPLRSIIQPVHPAMNVVRDIVEYLRITSGCQILVIRANTGSGKTTFLNTLSYYMQDIKFCNQTIDLQTINEDEFGAELRKIDVSSTEINLIILEGREKFESISDKYIQKVLADINRFARQKRVPLLIVIPTIEEQVARSWCDHGITIGDLIPHQKLYEGSRWYNFPGVAKDNYIEIAEETVRALNPPYSLKEFGVSQDKLDSWVDMAPTIGRFIETLANHISDIRSSTRMSLKGQRERVWIIFCNPNFRHYDHTYHIVDGLVQDEMFKVSPAKLIPPNSSALFSKDWRKSPNWARIVAAIHFLDVRIINFSITTLVTAALTYGDERLLRSFKDARLRDYENEIPEEMKVRHKNEPPIDWSQPLIERKQQPHNARESIGRSNLFALLRGLPAEPQKGGKSESITNLAQYFHLRDEVNESHLHYYIGCALNDLLKYHQFPGFIGIETEEPLLQGQIAPVPDITIHTETDIYALEFHFVRKQIAPSEISRYAVNNVIDKYMKSIPHLSSILETINE